MGIWGNAWQTPRVSATAAETEIESSLTYLGKSIESILEVIGSFESWFNDFEAPNFYMPTVAWENVDAAALMSYIDTLKAQFVVSPTIPTIDTGTMPTVNLPDVVEVQDTTLVDTIKNKLKNNINNLAYGLEASAVSRP